MKTYLKESQIKTDYVNLIKVVSLFSWIIFLVLTSNSNHLIEGFLFSVALITLAYMVIKPRPNSFQLKTKNEKNNVSGSSSSSEGYLNVFFAS